MAIALNSSHLVPSPQLSVVRCIIFTKILDCIKRIWEAIKSIFCCCQRKPVPVVPNPDVLSVFMEKERTIYEPALRDLTNAVEQYTLGRPLQERELADLTRRKEAAEALFMQENQEYENVRRHSQAWPNSTYGMQYRMSGISAQISRLLTGQTLERREIMIAQLQQKYGELTETVNLYRQLSRNLQPGELADLRAKKEECDQLFNILSNRLQNRNPEDFGDFADKDRTIARWLQMPPGVQSTYRDVFALLQLARAI